MTGPIPLVRISPGTLRFLGAIVVIAVVGFSGGQSLAAALHESGEAAVSSAALADYHGNVDSKIFHKSSCRYYNCKKCTKVFKTKQEATDAGYRACKVCKP